MSSLKCPKQIFLHRKNASQKYLVNDVILASVLKELTKICHEIVRQRKYSLSKYSTIKGYTILSKTELKSYVRFCSLLG